MSRAGVVTVTYGSAHLLDDHLGTVDFPPDTVVVVVDNHSTDEVRDEVAARCAERGWEFVAVPDNPGFGAGCNRGAEAAFALGCDVVFLLNPDASCSREVFEALVAECDANPMTMTGPALLRSDGRKSTSWHSVDLRRGGVVRRPGFDGSDVSDWLSTACVAIGRPLWEAVGGFDERYFLYWEDVDLCRRFHAAGGRLVPRPDLLATHDVGATQDGMAHSKSPLYVFMNCRNRLRYASKHQSHRSQLQWLLHTPLESLHIAERAGRRTLLRSPALWWAMVKGSFAGVGVLLRGWR